MVIEETRGGEAAAWYHFIRRADQPQGSSYAQVNDNANSFSLLNTFTQQPVVMRVASYGEDINLEEGDYVTMTYNYSYQVKVYCPQYQGAPALYLLRGGRWKHLL